MLRKPDAKKYTPYRLYEIVDGGKWTVKTGHDRVEFIQDLMDADSGYGYRYTKIVQLVKGKPQMILEHKLTNTGRHPIQTSVYDHNFLVLDHHPPGPDFTIKMPFALKSESHLNPEMAEVRGNVFAYRKVLEDRDTVATSFTGFGATPADYHIEINNSKLGAGLRITGNRPLSSEYLWSIRSTLAVEPYIDMAIAPGQSFDWQYEYEYYVKKP
jgi:hypothetical protein